ncbi:MAG TPA: PEP-CTERM sorting domain-containing protein [Azonexus sp.]|nr:PEP-CTERM sorting domain-containing protein [Azonexus sp.]
MNKSLKHALGTFCTASLLTLASLPAQADVPVFNDVYPRPSSACATFGNLVSCSTAVLDYLAGVPTAGYVGPYSFGTSQGALIDTIVLGTNNGNILNNGDIVPTGSEDSFSTITPGKDYFFTGDSGNDPLNNGTLLGDTAFSWDMSMNSLINALTFDGAFHQMLIGFDMNQPQNSTASLPIWALITVRDVDGNKQNIYFETQNLDPNNIFKDPLLYQSDKTFDGTGVTTPGADDFALTVGTICVVDAVNSYPSPDGTSCPQGGTLINTNRGSNQLEFVNYLPGLDLQALFAIGYDTISVQVWMGCFNSPPPNGPDTSGPPLLNNGSVGDCDTGGFGDIFLMAGAANTQVPEPGTLALLGIALLGFGYRRYHKR